jgi:hypothetical protein
MMDDDAVSHAPDDIGRLARVNRPLAPRLLVSYDGNRQNSCAICPLAK